MSATRFWACTAAGSCITSFVTAALPYLQLVAVVLSIAAGIRAVFGGKKK